MNQEDIRPGNRLKNTEGKVETVTYATASRVGVVFGEYPIDALSPIDITEDELTRMGFERCKFPKADPDGVYRDAVEESRDYFRHPDMPDEVSYYLPYGNLNMHVMDIEVKHVHHMQNVMYFMGWGKKK